MKQVRKSRAGIQINGLNLAFLRVRLLRWSLVALFVPVAVLTWHYKTHQRDVPVTETSPWKDFVQVKGQALPIPAHWLLEEEAQIAHNLELPNSLNQIVPFDFEKARKEALKPWGKTVSQQYFDHLCDYEAGEWILKDGEPQPGVYEARPIKVFNEKKRESVFFYESPHYELIFRDGPEVPREILGVTEPMRGWGLSSSSPLAHFHLVEQPRPNEPWALEFKKKYIRHQQEARYDSKRYWDSSSPWVITELDAPTVKYGTTWRGLLRPRDREHRIAGHEQLIYDIKTHEVLALRRTFRRMQATEWPGSLQCGRVMVSGTDSEYHWHLPKIAVPSLKKGVKNQDIEPRLRRPLPDAYKESRED